jgi:peptidoglycan/xylan/chitin deacetylase (PgdA/CDA1 family)
MARQAMSPAERAGIASSTHAERLSLRNIPMILMYHAVADVPDDPNQLCVSPSRFAEQMTWLDRRGLRGVSIATLIESMHAGTHHALVGITFDDGYTSILEAALPELHRHGFGATAFIISDRIGGTNEWDEGPAWPLLSADEVRELAAAGIEIGSHSATHPRLAGVDAGRLAVEVKTSREKLSTLLGSEVRGFAYPYGSMDAESRAAVGQAGYQYACAVETPRAELGILALPRVYIGQRDVTTRMAKKLRFHKTYILLKGRHG